MTPRQQVLWQQGDFLQPQHFQLQDLASQALLEPVYRFALPYFWGVAELALDERALAEGSLVLQKGSFLFRDGTFASLGENAVVEGRVLQDAWQGEEAAVTVHIGLRRWNDSGVNVSFADGAGLSGLTTRLVASRDPEPVCDLHAGGPAAEMQRQNLLLKLFLDRELPHLGDYHLIPLARLERAGEGARVVEGFVPPVVSLSASPCLGKTAEGLRQLLSARLSELKRRRPGQGGSALTRGDLGLIMAHSALGSHLPLLSHQLNSPATHPFHFFVPLCRLVGELSAFASPAAGEGPGAPAYDHTDLAGSFAAARDRLTALLDEIAVAPDDVIPLLREGSVFSGEVKDGVIRKGRQYLLSLRSKADPLVMLRALQSSVKASTRDHLQVLSTRALPGIGLNPLQITPPGVAPRPDTLYVELDPHHEQWSLVSSQHNLALYWDDSPADLQVELVVLGNRSAS